MDKKKSQRQGTMPAAAGYAPTLTAKEHHRVISALGIKKANTRVWQLGLLGVLAGVYISFGGLVSLVALNEGMGRIAAGTVFSVGLVLVVIAGAELFTGNIIMIVGAITRQYSMGKLLRNWLAVYLGNWAGAYAFAVAVMAAGLLGSVGALNGLGTLAATVADAKLALPFGEAFVRGVLCNMLVVLALIMAMLARDIVSKILCCIFPIMTFVACGFEHCVANMFLIPAGLLAKGMPLADQWVMMRNLVPVTLGNIVGGLLILVLHPNRLRQLWHLYRQPG
jgi:formate/nitrite transporter